MTETKTLRGDRNQCPACNEYFNSTHAFEKHRHGDYGIDHRCLTPFEMMEKGMHVGSDDFWRGSRREVETLPEAA